jgi:hypothetical protein
LPSRFEIKLVPNSGRIELCEVVWRQGKTIGVKFIHERDLLALCGVMSAYLRSASFQEAT